MSVGLQLWLGLRGSPHPGALTLEDGCDRSILMRKTGVLPRSVLAPPHPRDSNACLTMTNGQEKTRERQPGGAQTQRLRQQRRGRFLSSTDKDLGPGAAADHRPLDLGLTAAGECGSSSSCEVCLASRGRGSSRTSQVVPAAAALPEPGSRWLGPREVGVLPISKRPSARPSGPLCVPPLSCLLAGNSGGAGGPSFPEVLTLLARTTGLVCSCPGLRATRAAGVHSPLVWKDSGLVDSELPRPLSKATQLCCHLQSGGSGRQVQACTLSNLSFLHPRLS